MIKLQKKTTENGQLIDSEPNTTQQQKKEECTRNNPSDCTAHDCEFISSSAVSIVVCLLKNTCRCELYPIQKYGTLDTLNIVDN